MLHLGAIAYCVTLLATIASARTDFSGTRYIVEDFQSYSPSGHGNGTGNTTVMFTVNDPDPVGNETTVCGVTWLNGTAPTNYISCKDRSWGWYMSPFTSIYDFTLELTHSFSDPRSAEMIRLAREPFIDSDLFNISVGPAPYDVVTTFGRAVVDRSALDCVTDLNEVSCGLRGDLSLEVPLYAAIAK